MTKKSGNVFGDIINAHQHETSETPAAPAKNTETRGGKRGNPDYSAVTVYIPTEVYARAQFEMSRRGRKREMSELFTELLEVWLRELS